MLSVTSHKRAFVKAHMYWHSIYKAYLMCKASCIDRGVVDNF